MKIELRNKVPFLAVIRDLLYENETKNITSFLEPKLNFPPGRMKKRKNLQGQLANDWTMKNAWPNESENHNLQKLTIRVEHVLGDILASSVKNQSDYMCGNYGIGGFYGVHADYFEYDPNNVFRYHKDINRIATVMTVLEAPEAGGATVFPYLGQAVFPKTGSAVVWFNVKPSGQPIPEVKHAACPTLLGQKWSKSLFLSLDVYLETVCSHSRPIKRK